MKKKIITSVIGVCLAASVFAGCNSDTKETAVATRIDGGQTQISVETSQNSAAPAGYYFTYNGFNVVPGTDAQPVKEFLGEPIEEPYEGMSCAGQGMDIIYEYQGISLYTHELDGYEYVSGVEITSSLIDCNGVSVGDSIANAKLLYGTPASEDDFGVRYDDGSTHLEFITDGVETIEIIRYYYR